jgi:hypothetical protein
VLLAANLAGLVVYALGKRHLAAARMTSTSTTFIHL